MKSKNKIQTEKVSIWIEDGILHLKIKEGENIDLQEVETHFRIYKELGILENKLPQLFEGGNFFQFNSDAMKFVVKNGNNYFLASAVVVNSISMRILYNFFKNFFKQTFPFKMFETRDEALNWLRAVQKENNA